MCCVPRTAFRDPLRWKRTRCVLAAALLPYWHSCRRYIHPLLTQSLVLFIQMYSHGIELACQRQKEFVKSSVACKWNLAEAQQKLGSLALHNSESLDQEHAKAQTAVSELRQREEEWRQKEEALVQRERTCLWNVDAISKDVFNKVWALSPQRKKKEGWVHGLGAQCARGPGLYPQHCRWTGRRKARASVSNCRRAPESCQTANPSLASCSVEGGWEKGGRQEDRSANGEV